jgi:4-azaleucine resistance transporter AzlC
MSAPRSEFIAGARATLPLLAGDLPFGLIYGVQGAAAHVPALVIVAMSSVIFAGSAQLIAVTQLGAVPPVPSPVMGLTTLVVNLRHILYSASMGPRWRHLSRGWKWLLAYLLTDEAYAVGNGRYLRADDSPHKHWYYLGAGLALWVSWQLVTLLGVLVGGQIPGRWDPRLLGRALLHRAHPARAAGPRGRRVCHGGRACSRAGQQPAAQARADRRGGRGHRHGHGVRDAGGWAQARPRARIGRMTLWLTVLLGGLITYAERFSLIVPLGPVTLSPVLVRGLRFVPPAVLTAIIVPELLLPHGELDFSLGNARLLAGVLAAVIAWWSRNVILTVVSGMVTLWVLTALLPR